MIYDTVLPKILFCYYQQQFYDTSFIHHITPGYV
jgi:hypothetical protein